MFSLKCILSFFAFLIAGQCIHGQKIQYNLVGQYRMEYKTDSLQEKPKVENFILMMNKDEAAFVSTKEFFRDSLLTYSNESHLDIMRKYFTKNSYFIRTLLKSQKTIFSDRVDDANLKYEESLSFHWKLENEFKKIGKISCNKATVEAFGRKWEAWYSTEYPYPFGPYKFYGLPGLIVEIYDKTGSYHFTLFNFKKENLLYNEEIHKGAKMVTKNELVLAKNNSNTYGYVFRNITFEEPKVAREIRESMEKKMKSRNNPIELE